MDHKPGEGVVDKAVGYVKELFGIPERVEPSYDEGPPPIQTIIPERDLAAEDDTGMYPREDTLKSAAQLNAESARREDGE